MRLKLPLLILTTITTLNATEITSQGYANNKTDSKKEALSTLSNKISVDVKSDFKTYTSVLDKDYKKDTKKLIHLSSNLPLKGVVFYDDEEYDSIVTTAILSSKNSLNSYIVELKRLNKNISQSTKQLKSTKDNNQKYNILNQLIKDIENFNKHKIVATLDKQAYKHTKYKPSTKTFDESLNSGFVKSGKLSVNIGFKGFSRADGIDLNDGDIVDIIVKTNKPICYFLLGHTLKEDSKFSYILPIGSDNDPYINQITGNDVNKNIIIVDEVPISTPFGSENLQIFASTLKKNGNCPLVVPHCTEDEKGYCVVDGKPNKVILRTRALNIKKKKFKIEQSEASISFTSFGK